MADPAFPMKLKPGFHELGESEYFDLPALSAGGAHTIIDECPLKYWHDSPFNPDRVPRQESRFDVGTAAHLAILEPDRFAQRVAVVDADDWRTKAAQAAREAARAEDKVPLLVGQAEQVLVLRKALLAHPIASAIFQNGFAEQSVVWRDKETGIPCKLRADWWCPEGGYVADLKVHASANPRKFARTGTDLGYPLRAAWYMDGLAAVRKEPPKHYWFVIVEREAPHCITVGEWSERALEYGRLLYRQALATLAHCIVRDECPGYRDPAHPDHDTRFCFELPTYAEYQLADRFEGGEFRAAKPDAQLLKRALDMQAPL